jgi:predicted O-linked N-acetylglucosamine transferase (SPINDLY family)
MSGAAPGDAAAGQRAADEEIARGQSAEDAANFGEAEALFRRATELAPAYPRAWLNLGNALHKQKRLDDAAAAHARATEIDASYLPAWFNLASVMVESARWEDAQDALARVLELQPQLADAHVLVSMTHEGRGDAAAACEALERAVALDPRLSGAWSNLGLLYNRRRMPADADRVFQRALEADPANATALIGLAELDLARGRQKEAAERLERAHRLLPDKQDLFSGVLFMMNMRDDLDPKAIARKHFEFGELMTRQIEALPRPPRRRGRRPLRVGYVSGDFMRHPVAWFIMPVLKAHDRAQVQSYCYSSGFEDELTPQIRKLADHWRNVAGWSHERVFDEIQRDEIDVLVDLSGHTTRNRLAVFARRAAPVQAGWLGYLNTTGLATMDYRITDRFTDPPGMTEALHSEQLARMPHSQWAYWPHTWAEPRDQPRAPGEPVVFGSFNQVAKITDACLDLWVPVLLAVPHSVLRIHAVPDAASADDLRRRLAARGVPPARVQTRGRVFTKEYLESIADVDIALDAYPYNGGTTTLDTYWMGTPLVAFVGERNISRSTYSVASSAGFDELVARDRAAYVEINARLARDGAARRALRRGLRARFEKSPVMDPQGFTRDLEALYRRWTDD